MSLGWKTAKKMRQFERLMEAVAKGHLDLDALEPDYIAIPEEPDRKWTDKRREVQHGSA